MTSPILSSFIPNIVIQKGLLTCKTKGRGSDLLVPTTPFASRFIENPKLRLLNLKRSTNSGQIPECRDLCAWSGRLDLFNRSSASKPSVFLQDRFQGKHSRHRFSATGTTG